MLLNTQDIAAQEKFIEAIRSEAYKAGQRDEREARLREKMPKRFLCTIGWHYWPYPKVIKRMEQNYLEQVCQFCSKRRYKMTKEMGTTVTGKEMCETIVKSGIIKKPDGSDYLPGEIWNASPMGELVHVFYLYEAAVRKLEETNASHT